MMIRIRSDPLIFGPLDPDPVIFSLDPVTTCNNGFIKLLYYINQNLLKRMVYKIEFMHTYLKYKYIFFFISI